MASSKACVSINVLRKTDNEGAIRAAIEFSDLLPPPGYSFESTNENVEIAHLKRTLKWKDPRGLFAYSSYSEYKDLWVWFDYGDKNSAVNELATTAFRCYELGGSQCFTRPTWKIRGKVVMMRLEPDRNFSPDVVFRRDFTLDEVYDTLCFFRDAEASAFKIAQKRDSVRNQKRLERTPGYHAMAAQMMANGIAGPTYFGSGMRTYDQVQSDKSDECAVCGKKQYMVGRLMKCSRCQSRYYCSRECQKKDWKMHKKTCKAPAR